MDINKLIDWGTEYFTEYLSAFFSTLQHPTLHFPPVQQLVEQQSIIIPGHTPRSGEDRLNPRLYTYLIISIFIGSTLNSIIPQRPSIPEITVTIVVTLAVWIIYSLVTFGVCRLIGGKGKFLETVSLSLQLLATIYVVSNLIALAWGYIAQTSFLENAERSYLLINSLKEHPVLLYNVIQAILMMLYLPLGIKSLYNFRISRYLITAIVPLTFTACIATVYLGTYVVLNRAEIINSPTAGPVTNKSAIVIRTPKPTSANSRGSSPWSFIPGRDLSGLGAGYTPSPSSDENIKCYPSDQAQANVLYGPQNCKFDHDPDGEYLSAHFSNISLADFSAEATFHNPYSIATGDWDYGFVFRHSNYGTHYFVIINSSKEWKLWLVKMVNGEEVFNVIGSGNVDNLDLSEDGYNNLHLDVKGSVAELRVNNVVVTLPPVDELTDEGEIGIVVNSASGSGKIGETTEVTDFIVMAASE